MGSSLKYLWTSAMLAIILARSNERVQNYKQLVAVPNHILEESLQVFFVHPGSDGMPAQSINPFLGCLVRLATESDSGVIHLKHIYPMCLRPLGERVSGKNFDGLVKLPSLHVRRQVGLLVAGMIHEERRRFELLGGSSEGDEDWKDEEMHGKLGRLTTDTPKLGVTVRGRMQTNRRVKIALDHHSDGRIYGYTKTHSS